MTAPKPQALTFFGEPMNKMAGSGFCDPVTGAEIWECFDGIWQAQSSFYVVTDRNPHTVTKTMQRRMLEHAIAVVKAAGGWVEGVDEEYLR